MAAKKFNFQFEDIRRGDTPVVPSGFGDLPEEPDNPEAGFIEVDLNEEDDDKAISVVQSDSTDDAGNGADTDDAADDRRERLRQRRASRKVADDAINEARGEVAQELDALHGRINTLEGDRGVAAAETEYDTAKADIEAKMVQAMEDGKSEEYATLNSQLIELNNDLQEKKMTASAPHRPDAPQDLATGDPSANQPANPRAIEFIKANENWWTDPDREEEVDYARRLDKKLVTNGYDPRSDRYWNAFNRNFDNKYPDLRQASDDDIDIDLDDDTPKRGAGSPVHRPGAGGGVQKGTGKGGDKPKGGGSKVRLTQADKQNMVRFGLDPADPEHCKNYALNKVPDEGARP